MKRFKESLKEEEKQAIKRIEAATPKSERKVVVNKTKLDLQSQRAQKVGVFPLASCGVNGVWCGVVW